MQQDIIPTARGSSATINMEDGFILADEGLRQRLRKLDKSLMERCWGLSSLTALPPLR